MKDTLDLAVEVIIESGEKTLSAAQRVGALSSEVLLDKDSWTELVYDLGNFTREMVDLVILATTGAVPKDPEVKHAARMAIINETALAIRANKVKRPGT